jgi:hypothetical protein
MTQPDDLWCCAHLQPYKARRTDHDAKFEAFVDWTKCGAETSALCTNFVIQFVKNVNFGSVVAKRCFAFDRVTGAFNEVSESSKMRSLNSFKNYRCATCDGRGYFYELNLYCADEGPAVSAHHQSTRTGVTFVRDAAGIDMARGVDKGDHWK